jgi:hypothetical protein
MPQRLTHVKFSGMTIRDNKDPFIFLAGGDHGDDQEPDGRTLFTLALITVLVARRIFARGKGRLKFDDRTLLLV